MSSQVIKVCGKLLIVLHQTFPKVEKKYISIINMTSTGFD